MIMAVINGINISIMTSRAVKPIHRKVSRLYCLSCCKTFLTVNKPPVCFCFLMLHPGQLSQQLLFQFPELCFFLAAEHTADLRLHLFSLLQKNIAFGF